jgi:hypothetical protein
MGKSETKYLFLSKKKKERKNLYFSKVVNNSLRGTLLITRRINKSRKGWRRPHAICLMLVSVNLNRKTRTTVTALIGPLAVVEFFRLVYHCVVSISYE